MSYFKIIYSFRGKFFEIVVKAKDKKQVEQYANDQIKSSDCVIIPVIFIDLTSPLTPGPTE